MAEEDGRRNVDVLVEMEIGEEQERDDDLGQRWRNYTLNRFAGMFTPLLDRVNNSTLSTLQWLNENNEENTPVNNVNVTISNSHDVAVSVDISQDPSDDNNTGNASSSPPNNNQNETDQNTFQRDPENNNNNNQINRTTIDLNINEHIPDIIMIVMFILILLIKFLFDHFEGVVTFTCLHIIMCVFVSIEQVNVRNRSTWRMIVVGLCILKCLCYILDYEGLPCTLFIYNPDYESPTDIWNLFWILYMNDCALKFMTMGSKLLVKFLPHRIMSFKTKLRIYFFFEATSQLYRGIVPIQPWIAYFSMAYRDSAYAFSIFLIFMYVILKCYDILRKSLLALEAIKKLFQRSTHSPPTKEHMASIGTKCSICLDDFENPVQLSCNHVFCSTCITQWATKNKSCPLCRTAMVEDFAPKHILTAMHLQLY